MFNWLLGVNAIGRKPSFEQRANFVDQGTINSSKLKASTLNRASRSYDTCAKMWWSWLFKVVFMLRDFESALIRI